MSQSQLEDELYYQEQEKKRKEIQESLELSKQAVENVQLANQAAATVNQSAVGFNRPELVAPTKVMDDGQDLAKLLQEQQAQFQKQAQQLQQNQAQAAQQQQQLQSQQSAQHAQQQAANLQSTLQAKAISDRAAQQQHEAQKAQQAEQQKANQPKPQAEQERAQQATPGSPERPVAQGYESPSMSPGRSHSAGGNTWGADNQINEKWALHEREQSEHQKQLDAKGRDIANREAKGEDVAIDKTQLQMSQNEYAIKHHDHNARSFSQTEAYAKATSIGGQRDTQTIQKAQDMRAHHQYQSEKLREQQTQLQEQLKQQQEQKKTQEQGQELQKKQAEQQTQQQSQNPDQGPSKAEQAKQALNTQLGEQTQQNKPDTKGQGMENEGKSAEVKDTKEVKQETKAYDPRDRVRAAEERGQEIKRENQANGKTVTADDTKSLQQQNEKSKEIEKSQSEAKEKEQEKGKQISR